jgi:hypothetical protein
MIIGYLKQRFISELNSTSSTSLKVGYRLIPPSVKNKVSSLSCHFVCFYKASVKSSEGSNKGNILSTFGPRRSKCFVSKPVGSRNLSLGSAVLFSMHSRNFITSCCL